MTEWLECPKCKRSHPENSVRATRDLDISGKPIFQFYCFYCLTFLTTAPDPPEDLPKAPEK